MPNENAAFCNSKNGLSSAQCYGIINLSLSDFPPPKYAINHAKLFLFFKQENFKQNKYPKEIENHKKDKTRIKEKQCKNLENGAGRRGNLPHSLLLSPSGWHAEKKKENKNIFLIETGTSQ